MKDRYQLSQGSVTFEVIASSEDEAVELMNSNIKYLQETLSCNVGCVTYMHLDIPREFTKDDILKE